MSLHWDILLSQANKLNRHQIIQFPGVFAFWSYTFRSLIESQIQLF